MTVVAGTSCVPTADYQSVSTAGELPWAGLLTLHILLLTYKSLGFFSIFSLIHVRFGRVKEIYVRLCGRKEYLSLLLHVL